MSAPTKREALESALSGIKERLRVVNQEINERIILREQLYDSQATTEEMIIEAMREELRRNYEQRRT
jgi:hypothetical protein